VNLCQFPGYATEIRPRTTPHPIMWAQSVSFDRKRTHFVRVANRADIEAGVAAVVGEIVESFWPYGVDPATGFGGLYVYSSRSLHGEDRRLEMTSSAADALAPLVCAFQERTVDLVSLVRSRTFRLPGFVLTLTVEGPRRDSAAFEEVSPLRTASCAARRGRCRGGAESKEPDGSLCGSSPDHPVLRLHAVLACVGWADNASLLQFHATLHGWGDAASFSLLDACVYRDGGLVVVPASARASLSRLEALFWRELRSLQPHGLPPEMCPVVAATCTVAGAESSAQVWELPDRLVAARYWTRRRSGWGLDTARLVEGALPGFPVVEFQGSGLLLRSRGRRGRRSTSRWLQFSRLVRQHPAFSAGWDNLARELRDAGAVTGPLEEPAANSAPPADAADLGSVGPVCSAFPNASLPRAGSPGRESQLLLAALFQLLSPAARQKEPHTTPEEFRLRLTALLDHPEQVSEIERRPDGLFAVDPLERLESLRETFGLPFCHLGAADLLSWRADELRIAERLAAHVVYDRRTLLCIRRRARQLRPPERCACVPVDFALGGIARPVLEFRFERRRDHVLTSKRVWAAPSWSSPSARVGSHDLRRTCGHLDAGVPREVLASDGMLVYHCKVDSRSCTADVLVNKLDHSTCLSLLRQCRVHVPPLADAPSPLPDLHLAFCLSLPCVAEGNLALLVPLDRSTGDRSWACRRPVLESEEPLPYDPTPLFNLPARPVEHLFTFALGRRRCKLASWRFSFGPPDAPSADCDGQRPVVYHGAAPESWTLEANFCLVARRDEHRVSAMMARPWLPRFLDVPTAPLRYHAEGDRRISSNFFLVCDFSWCAPDGPAAVRRYLAGRWARHHRIDALYFRLQQRRVTERGPDPATADRWGHVLSWDLLRSSLSDPSATQHDRRDLVSSYCRAQYAKWLGAPISTSLDVGRLPLKWASSRPIGQRGYPSSDSDSSDSEQEDRDLVRRSSTAPEPDEKRRDASLPRSSCDCDSSLSDAYASDQSSDCVFNIPSFESLLEDAHHSLSVPLVTRKTMCWEPAAAVHRCSFLVQEQLPQVRGVLCPASDAVSRSSSRSFRSFRLGSSREARAAWVRGRVLRIDAVDLDAEATVPVLDCAGTSCRDERWPGAHSGPDEVEDDREASSGATSPAPSTSPPAGKSCQRPASPEGSERLPTAPAVCGANSTRAVHAVAASEVGLECSAGDCCLGHPAGPLESDSSDAEPDPPSDGSRQRVPFDSSGSDDDCEVDALMRRARRVPLLGVAGASSARALYHSLCEREENGQWRQTITTVWPVAARPRDGTRVRSQPGSSDGAGGGNSHDGTSGLSKSSSASGASRLSRDTHSGNRDVDHHRVDRDRPADNKADTLVQSLGRAPKAGLVLHKLAATTDGLPCIVDYWLPPDAFLAVFPAPRSSAWAGDEYVSQYGFPLRIRPVVLIGPRHDVADAADDGDDLYWNPQGGTWVFLSDYTPQLCPVCGVRAAQHLGLPCRHKCCSVCFEQLAVSRGKCWCGRLLLRVEKLDESVYRAAQTAAEESVLSRVASTAWRGLSSLFDHNSTASAATGNAPETKVNEMEMTQRPDGIGPRDRPPEDDGSPSLEAAFPWVFEAAAAFVYRRRQWAVDVAVGSTSVLGQRRCGPGIHGHRSLDALKQYYSFHTLPAELLLVEMCYELASAGLEVQLVLVLVAEYALLDRLADVAGVFRTLVQGQLADAGHRYPARFAFGADLSRATPPGVSHESKDSKERKLHHHEDDDAPAAGTAAASPLSTLLLLGESKQENQLRHRRFGHAVSPSADQR